MGAVHGRDVESRINYVDSMDVRPRFYATDYSRDNLVLDGRNVLIREARSRQDELSLDREGFVLRAHRSAVPDFRDSEAVQRVYLPEMREFLLTLTGASQVIMARGAVLRFGERSGEFGSRMNTRPARFVHVDYTARSIPVLMQPLLEESGYAPGDGIRFAGFNMWRVFSPPPQDVPLAVCDARTVAAGDLEPGDAVFDAPGAPEFSFEAYLVHANPAHRWSWFPDMTAGEVLVFKAFDSDPARPPRVPHVAFDDPACAAGVVPRASIEVRAFAFFD